MKITGSHKFQILLLLSILLSLLITTNQLFAQGSKERDVFEEEAYKDDPVFRVLGRHLTAREIGAYGKKLSYENAISQLLHREPDLVTVRALITVGAAKNAAYIVKNLYFSEPKTYEWLVKYFEDLKDKYGSVEKGVESEKNLKLSEKQIFEGTALKAYKTVFGVSPEDLTPAEQQDLFNFFKSKQATTFTKMVVLLVESLTEDDKKQILYELLDEINRKDLKQNNNFVSKILEQDFTHENLRELLQQLKK